MDQIRKEIHTAFLNVSQLCDQFFRKYPQNHPITAPIASGYPPYQYGSYQKVGSEFSSPVNEPWLTQYSSQIPVK
jgi:hypothetical protein